jgi:hypothetical protein
MKKVHYLIAVHSTNGVHSERIELSDEDEAFNDDTDGFDDFGEYEEHSLQDSIDEYEQRGYTAVTVKDEELDDIIATLTALKNPE